MSRFDYYIKEFQEHEDWGSSRVQKITEEMAILLLQDNARKAAEVFHRKEINIARITHTAQLTSYGFLDARKLPPRMSRNTINYYTLIMNGDKRWARFPKRQVIASYYKNYERESSDVFYIFPYDKTKVGFCSESDLWDSFIELDSFPIGFPGGTSAADFNTMIRNMLVKSNSVTGSEDENLSGLKSACSNFDKWFKRTKTQEMDLNNVPEEQFIEEISKLISLHSEKPKVYEYFLKKYYTGNLYEAALKVFNPSGFKVGYVYNTSAKKNGVEVWLDGPAVYVNAIKAEDLMEKVFMNE